MPINPWKCFKNIRRMREFNKYQIGSTVQVFAQTPSSARRPLSDCIERVLLSKSFIESGDVFAYVSGFSLPVRISSLKVHDERRR